jgi:putative DNA primase/helicase
MVRIDASLEQLLAATPPRTTVEWIEREVDTPGTPTRVCRLL